jgi:hypothetical protein
MIKLSNLIKEIEVGMGGRSILWGSDNGGRFIELVKLQGFSTSQEALDRINELYNELYPDEYYPYELSKSVEYPSYVYLSGGGQATFVKDLSEFSVGYQTEEDWGVTKWSKNPPL